jgi:hypothetical protein
LYSLPWISNTVHDNDCQIKMIMPPTREPIISFFMLSVLGLQGKGKDFTPVLQKLIMKYRVYGTIAKSGAYNFPALGS